MIRKANVQDAMAISELDSHMFKDSLGFAFIENDLKNNPMASYFVAVIEDRIVGYIGAWVADNTSILNFCVLDDYQKQGIGGLLFDEVLKIKVGMLSLEVSVTNEKAIRFYTKRGFVKALLRKNYYSNHEDAILMIRK